MNKLNIIKASAGSGKTHYLTGSIIRQLFLQPSTDYFKHILAVTFTNKATGEMKSRLIGELHKLASGYPSQYESLLEGIGYKGEMIRQKAALLLRAILHEYSWLSIETIDSFFQRVIRSFTRELGLPGNYAVELDTTRVLEYAVDQLIDSLGEDDDLLNWLILFAEDNIQEGKSWDFRNDLLQLSYELFKEDFSNHSDQLEEVIGDRKHMKDFRTKLLAIKGKFEKLCSGLGKQGLEEIDRHQLTDADFYQKKNGALKIFRKLAEVDLSSSNGELFTSLKVMDKLLESPLNWSSGDTTRKEDVHRLAERILLPLLEESVDLIENQYSEYQSALTLSQNLYALGILVDMSQKIKQYRYEKNAFMLSDSPVLIDRLINHNDTPFIYEKMGNRYANYFIDEFQDTSGLQWKNFKPLISNSLAQDHECFLVGDVKQSIYRWRNGDWEILARKVFEEYPAEIIQTRTLHTNWRSDERIVNFNSLFFSQALPLLKNHLLGELRESVDSFGDEIQLLGEVYGDVIQETPQKNLGRGNILLKFFAKEELTENAGYFQQALLDSLNELLKLGYPLRDIAIIVRDKKQGRRVADFLMAANAQQKFVKKLSFISDESLLLEASTAVNLLIAALRYINKEDELLYKAELISAFSMLGSEPKNGALTTEIIWQPLPESTELADSPLPREFRDSFSSFKSLPLYELTERLIQIFSLSDLSGGLTYLHAFLDLVFEYVKTERGAIPNFLEYWDEKGKLTSIPAAESQDAVRILTIHKSKGLEYRAVILPFCNWNFNQKTNSIFWVDIPKGFVDGVPVFPVNFSKSLKNTVFSRAYYTEMYRSYVDNLNLLYVAMTRARESLIAFPVYRDPEKRKGSLDTVGDLLYDTLILQGGESFGRYYSEGTRTMRIGFDEDTLQETRQDEDPEEMLITSGKSSSAMDRLFFSTQGSDYFSENYSILVQAKLRGNILHNILAGIHTQSDLDAALADATQKQVLPVEEVELLKEHILQCLSQEKIARWFDGSGRVLNEADILLPNGHSKRPDRLVMWDDAVHVIDYKFGSDKEEKKHRSQVSEYISILNKMGYRNVRGFLWYLDLNEVLALNEEVPS